MGKFVIGISLLLSLANNCYASSISGKVAQTLALSAGNAVFVYVSATATGGPPACASQTSLSVNPRYALNAGTPAGKAAVAMAMTAQVLGKGIMIQGTGTCTLWGDTEDAFFIVMGN